MRPNPVPKKNLILISLSLLALAAMIVAFTPNTTLADEGVPIKGTFTVTFVFIESADACGAGDTACMVCTNPPSSGSFIEAQGIGDTSRLGALFFEVRKCLDSTLTPSSVAFTLTAPNGKDSLTGTLTGALGTGDSEGFQPFSAKLTFTEGTGRFRDARGSAKLTGVASPNNMAFFSVDGKLEFRDDD